jgi:hypothetical protein
LATFEVITEDFEEVRVDYAALAAEESAEVALGQIALFVESFYATTRETLPTT